MIPGDDNAAFFEILPNLPDDLGIDHEGSPTSDFRNGGLIAPKHEGPLHLALGDATPLPLPAGLFGRRIALANDQLVSVLLDAGVGNLQLFPALLHHRASAAPLPGYQVVNVLGLMDAAAPDLSTGDVLVDTGGEVELVDYEHLVISRSRTLGMDFFLLATNPEKLIISGRVMNALLQHVPEAGWGFVTEELETC